MRHRWIMTCVCLLMAGVGLASAPYAMKNGIAPAGVGGYPDFFSSVSSGEAPTPTIQETAWDTLRTLTASAEHLDEQTTWERDWETKCEVKLEVCANVAPIPVSAARALAFHKRLGSNLKVTRQTVTRSGADHKPSFSMIWFNPAAQRSVAAGIRNLTLNHPVDGFQKDATIVKAIWSLVPVPASGAGITDSKLTVSRIECPIDECWQPGATQSLSDIPDAGNQYWRNTPIDLDAHATPTACDQTDAIPVGCLHAFLLDEEKSGDVEVSPRDPAVNRTCGSEKCLVVLVGIHIMKRVVARDAAGASGWEFMTFWWTGTDNHIAGLKGPWRFFQMNATRTVRNDAGGPQGYNIAFGPYLEGANASEASGAVANCVTCHGFAAYDTSQAHASKMLAGVQPCTGAPSLPASTLCAGQVVPYTDKTAAYWQGAVGTDFVWSFATYKPLPVAPPPH